MNMRDRVEALKREKALSLLRSEREEAISERTARQKEEKRRFERDKQMIPVIQDFCAKHDMQESEITVFTGDSRLKVFRWNEIPFVVVHEEGVPLCDHLGNPELFVGDKFAPCPPGIYVCIYLNFDDRDNSLYRKVQVDKMSSKKLAKFLFGLGSMNRWDRGERLTLILSSCHHFIELRQLISLISE